MAGVPIILGPRLAFYTVRASALFFMRPNAVLAVPAALGFLYCIYHF